MEDLTAASDEDVRDFFRTYYAPGNASLVIAGLSCVLVMVGLWAGSRGDRAPDPGRS